MNLENPAGCFGAARGSMRLRKIFFVVFVRLLALISPLTAQTYSPPASSRQDISLDANWRFIQSDVPAATNTVFDDSSWTNLNLPHTWDIAHGQSTPSSAYYTGNAWYRTRFTVADTNAGHEIFLKFDGAFLVADVWVNGIFLGEHQGGFSAFAFDVTTNVLVGAGTTNVIAVKVNNLPASGVTANVIPLLPFDFTPWGGIYRDVHLLVTDPVQISPLDYASPGVYLMPTNVSASSASLKVTTVLSNATAVATNIMLRTVITDAATNIVATLTNFVTLTAGSGSNVVANTIIANPHLWNGLADPYLYQAYVEVWKGSSVVDLVAQPLGFRFFSVDPTNGFFLNGVHYDLHGVSMHQDWINCGWALTDAQRETNFMFIKEIGATVIRMSHYEHHDYEFTLADRNGVILWDEVPFIDPFPSSNSNILQQVHELVKQRMNHPSVVFWGMYNEIHSGTTQANYVQAETNAVWQDDQTRLTTAASAQADNASIGFRTDVIAFNKYYGWYDTPIDGLAAWADNIHSNFPARPTGVSEFGAGGSIYQHSENPTQPATGGHSHWEEWQDLVHETNWLVMKARPFLWGKFVWNLFDFASDTRNEGDTAGRNDKGLVTYDRQVRKDAFYFYKASWTTNPMVYITGHTFTNRTTNITAKVYANCDTVQLFVNGFAQGSVANTNCTFHWPVVLSGTNTVQAIGIKGGIQVTDTLIWIAPGVTMTNPPATTNPPVAAIIMPATNVVYLNSTNDTLLLTATASNTVPTNAMTTVWSQTGGPGSVTFGNPGALTTTASFSATGTYGITFTASNGVATNLNLTVAVGTLAAGSTNGLLGWWPMDETGGLTAFDSSGNGQDATLNGGTFTNGDIGDALHLPGGTNNAQFISSVDATQTTIAAWVRADSRGGSLYPHILGTPGYHLIFRFDTGSFSNSLDFATAKTAYGTTPVNGEWLTAANTISTGAWYHVAVSYDNGSLANVPSLYINGVKMAITTSTTPSVTPPAYAGTNYIGNRLDLARGWDGLIDDLRIYNRLLSDAEVQALASVGSQNLAPVVNAGANQTVVLPAAAALNGTVNDDGEPTPPGALSLAWSEVSGPGTVTFAAANAPATAANFSATGSYQLQLAANDGQVTTVSGLTLTVVTRPDLSFQLLPGAFQLSWPTNNGNWQLQYQTNPITTGLWTNWQNVPGPLTNPFVAPIDPNAATAFYRLILMTN
jgi:beta-galactosidase